MKKTSAITFFLARTAITLLLALTSTAVKSESGVLVNGIYYIQNVETGKYLNAGNAWGTHAVLADEGLPVRSEKQPDGSYTFCFLEGSGTGHLLFRDDDTNVYVDYNPSQDRQCPYWSLQPTGKEGVFRVQSLITDSRYGQDIYPGTYLGNNPQKEATDQNGIPLGIYNDIDGDITDVDGMNINWRFVDQDEYLNPGLKEGVYSITCPSRPGYIGLGAYHGADAYIYNVTSGNNITDDGYWQVTKGRNGYIFRNEASGQYLVFTYDRVDQYYKYMTLADELPDDDTAEWELVTNTDGTLCFYSMADTNYYWNLRMNDTNLLGTYSGSSGNDENEHFIFRKKGSEGSGGQDEEEEEEHQRTSFPDALHVFLANGGLEAYPLEYVTSYQETDGRLVIETNIGKTFSYSLGEVSSVTESKPADFPTFESFKFNNKYNDQVLTDCIGTIDSDTVFVTVGAIGKRLTPSFKLPDNVVTEVFVNGELQNSKISRLRFDHDIYYTITRPSNTILLPTPDSTDYTMQPYGRIMRVHVDWLTDKATSVPRIDINIANGEFVTSKDYFLDAEITIDGQGVFPDMAKTPVQIKGRGNSSWGWPKRPYRLKFENKVKPFGMTKGKSWVLLANYQTGSLMANAIGMKAANLIQTVAPNHIVPVELYINGEYQGSYNFTEKVGFSNNSIDLANEDAAALLELDTYYDEPEGQKFRTQHYRLPINVKEPDFSEGTSSITLQTVQDSFNQFEDSLYNKKSISSFVDEEQLVRYMMVNELILNYEFYHPKSTFCYRENFLSDQSKYIFGPVWDLDWAFGYERHSNYFLNEANIDYWTEMPYMEAVRFVQDLRFSSPKLTWKYKKNWEKFMNDDLAEIMEYAQDYYDYAHTSFEHNKELWGDYTDYASQAVAASRWLEQRASKVYAGILQNLTGDVNGDGKLTIVDVTSIISHIHGQTPSDFNEATADMNGDGVVDNTDVKTVIDIILEK